MNRLGDIEILLIEDNCDEASLITKILDNHSRNINIMCIGDGREAMDYLYKRDNYKDSRTPSLIILDLGLPNKDGREILGEIKTDAQLKYIPVIVLTNSDSNRDILESYEHYANAYITKSTDFDKFNKDMYVFIDFWLNGVILPSYIG
ncbi:response regulator [Methanobacterium sp.]|uniref:response regulator n=1 Tax=Methanobacterium sp. TaxID=2164 RepID=UPI003C763DD9